MIEDTFTPHSIGRTFNIELGTRLRQVASELHGEQGTKIVAGIMSIPVRTLENFERGIALPAEILLSFIAATGADPDWLRTGKGAMFPRLCRRRDVRGSGTEAN